MQHSLGEAFLITKVILAIIAWTRPLTFKSLGMDMQNLRIGDLAIKGGWTSEHGC